MKDPGRRCVVLGSIAGTVVTTFPQFAIAQEETMFGLIGRIKVAPGQRETVMAALLDASRSMPGCLSYVVAQDPSDPNAIWVTEAWQSKEHHQASLSLPSTQRAIAQAKPHITGFGERFETVPIGGHGLSGTSGVA